MKNPTPEMNPGKMTELFWEALNFGGAIVVGGVAGALADNVVGVSSLWFVYSGWSGPSSAVALASIGSLTIVPLGWLVELVTGLPAAVVMMAAFTAMPNFRAALKSIVLGIANPINSRLDSL